MFCQRCGSLAKGDDRFCTHCGVPLGAPIGTASVFDSSNRQNHTASAPPKPSRVVTPARTIVKTILVVCICGLPLLGVAGWYAFNELSLSYDREHNRDRVTYEMPVYVHIHSGSAHEQIMRSSSLFEYNGELRLVVASDPRPTVGPQTHDVFTYQNIDEISVLISHMGNFGPYCVQAVRPQTVGRDAELLQRAAALGLVLCTSPVPARALVDVTLDTSFKPLAGFLAPVEEDGRWGFINEAGEYQIAPQFEDAGPFFESVAGVKAGGKVGYVNLSGAFVISPQFEQGKGFSDSLAAVQLGTTWGFIGHSGSFVICPQYTDAGGFSQGLAPVKIGDWWGFINRESAIVISPRFAAAQSFAEGLAAVEEDGLWGYIDSSGAYIITPKFRRPGGFQHGLAPVSVDKMWGFIDHKGQFIIEPQFLDANPFLESKAEVQLGNRWGLVDESGRFYPVGDEGQIDGGGPFSGNLALMAVNEHWGFVEANGMFAIAPKYQNAWQFTTTSREPVDEQHSTDQQIPGCTIQGDDARSPSHTQ